MGVYITKINKIGEKEEKTKRTDYKDIEKREQEHYWKYYKEETNLQIINNKEIERRPDPGIFIDISNLDSFLRRPEKERIGNA